MSPKQHPARRRRRFMLDMDMGHMHALSAFTPAQRWVIVAGLIPILADHERGEPLMVGKSPLNDQDIAWQARASLGVTKRLMANLLDRDLFCVDARGAYILTRKGRLWMARFCRVPGLTSRDSLSPARRAAVILRDGGACAICGSDDGAIEIDHVFPWSLGGSDDLNNLQVLCPPCNRAKAATV